MQDKYSYRGMDYMTICGDTNDNVYMFVCHGGTNQLWRFLPSSDSLTTWYDHNLCLTYGFASGDNVYMFRCIWNADYMRNGSTARQPSPGTQCP